MRKPLSFDEYVEILLDANKELAADNFYHARDHYALENALDHGCYANHLDRWVGNIDDSKLLLVVFEELIRSTPQQLSRIGEFFGLSLTEQDVGSLKKENETVNVRYPGINRLVRTAGRLVPGEHIKKTLRDIYLNLQRTEVPDLYGLYPESIEALSAFYKPHNERLKQEYGIDVSLWRSRRCETENSVESTSSHN